MRAGGPLAVPGVADALTARLAERAGFPLAYVTGAGVANAAFGVPDIGLVSFAEMLETTARIAAAVEIPLLVDGDTGYGGVANVARAVREYERAGIAGIQIEDQAFPKRCGHFEEKSVVPVDEMLYRLQAALDARRSPDFLVIARTDARAIEGLDAALERARRYRELGADMLFVEAPQSLEELRAIPAALPGVPLLANMVEGGKTPLLDAAALHAMGYALTLFANAALRWAALAIRDGFEELRRTGTTHGTLDRMLSWRERQELVGLAGADAYERELVRRVDEAGRRPAGRE